MHDRTMPDRLDYVCGHSAAELDRLALQSRVYEPFTRRALVAAGLHEGMPVVDLGCGAGDVSLLAGELVGPRGSVVGVDRSGAAVATASARAAQRDLAHVRFEVAELDRWSPVPAPEAAVGRFVLMHQRDPRGLLAHVRNGVRPGGVVLFIESDISACRRGSHSRPHSPTYDRIVEFWKSVLGSAGVHLDLAARMETLFVAAGLPTPTVTWGHHASSDPASAVVPFAVESVRSMLPMAAQAGVSAPCDGDMSRLLAQLRDDVRRLGCALVAPPVAAAWVRLPVSA